MHIIVKLKQPVYVLSQNKCTKSTNYNTHPQVTQMYLWEFRYETIADADKI